MGWETLGLVALVIAGVFGLPAAVRQLMRGETIFPWQRGLLYVDGKFVRLLEPGRHNAFDPLRRRRIEVVSTAPETARPMYDVVSADRLVYRLTAAVEFAVVDPQLWREANGRQSLFNAVERAITEAAAGRTLDEALRDRKWFHDALASALRDPIGGAALKDVSIAAITLPPEIRRAYAEAERARHESAAALERARGEQASLRSLANAARMLKNNPELMNLRLLQAVGSGGSGSSIVLGDGALSTPRRR